MKHGIAIYDKNGVVRHTANSVTKVDFASDAINVHFKITRRPEEIDILDIFQMSTDEFMEFLLFGERPGTDG